MIYSEETIRKFYEDMKKKVAADLPDNPNGKKAKTLLCSERFHFDVRVITGVNVHNRDYVAEFSVESPGNLPLMSVSQKMYLDRVNWNNYYKQKDKVLEEDFKATMNLLLMLGCRIDAMVAESVETKKEVKKDE